MCHNELKKRKIFGLLYRFLTQVGPSSRRRIQGLTDFQFQILPVPAAADLSDPVIEPFRRSIGQLAESPMGLGFLPDSCREPAENRIFPQIRYNFIPEKFEIPFRTEYITG